MDSYYTYEITEADSECRTFIAGELYRPSTWMEEAAEEIFALIRYRYDLTPKRSGCGLSRNEVVGVVARYAEKSRLNAISDGNEPKRA